MPPRIAITLGDPRGIGPEVVGKTLADPPAQAVFVVIGPDEQVAELPADERIGIGPVGTAIENCPTDPDRSCEVLATGSTC